MKSQRKIWELQHTTVCKVVGMALDLEDLKKIGRKFGLVFHEVCIDEEFALHSALVGMCGKEGNIARHVQKLIERRSLRYAKRLAHQSAHEIAEIVLNGDENTGIPLWAILWHLATSRVSDSDSLETALFGRIHILEHKLLKDFWNEREDDGGNADAELRDEINGLRKEVIRLRSLNADLEKAKQLLTARLNQSSEIFVRSPSPPSNDTLGPSNDQDKKVRRLRNLLEESRKKNQGLEEECSRAKRQMEFLTQELLSHDSSNCTENEKSINDGCPCQLTHCLRGKRIAMVGGIDSLEAHYKNLVERSGGEFCRHNGRCCRGERRLEECIRSADLVVCPISVNSHFGANGVKKVCRRYGIDCCFPDSAGLGSLRNTLLQHFASNEEAPGESIDDSSAGSHTNSLSNQ
ncbi:MAG: DUF2325 domain-containing protein [Desulfomonile tiedjei]|uniref:DUF2325 domain-containing protein n=1 Tax=Desulfomonile tiedjei TaxID=2358 RepID=A0A9D6Z4A7_9BACT|nr:DUF2325 domain-containing protein [Desulfomonile tiedjei]